MPVSTRSLRLISLLIGMATITAHADDTEVFVKQNAGEVKPNLLMMLDNSGSMDSDVIGAPTPYDPNGNYSGSYDNDAYYWDNKNQFPEATSNQKIPKNLYRCGDGKEELDDHGIYAAKHQMWFKDNTHDDNSQWGDLVQDAPVTNHVECVADQGVHGKASGNNKKYIADGRRGPWTRDSHRARSWDDINAYYTIFSGHYLNYRANPPTQRRDRFEVMQHVVTELVRRLININVGIAWFNSGDGGFIAAPVANVDVPENREELISILSSHPGRTATPLSETLYETYLYYAGKNKKYGSRSVSSAMVSGSSNTYQSPIQYECQRNYTLMMTDGDPWSDNNANSLIEGLPSFANATGNTSCDGNESNGRCMDDLSKYMSNGQVVDLAPNRLDGNQTVTTHAIGFTINKPLLQETATGSGGVYFTADNADELASAFNNILNLITKEGDSFVAPAISVDSFSRIVNRNALYFSMFTPSALDRWKGNLKRYRLAHDSNGKAYITDSTAASPNVVDADKGSFIDGAKSYWSSSIDGNDTLKGGFRDTFSSIADINSRKVWSNLSSDTSLSADGNSVELGNSQISSALLQVGTDSERDRLIKWLRGVDIKDEDADNDTNDARAPIGDPLHSQPVAIQFGGTKSDPELVIFFTTNDGFLHAVRERDGKELFAFIPKSQLGLTKKRFDNDASGRRIYGLDGSLTTEVIDKNNNGKIEYADGDRVYLYFGMRRGGNKYYALDVSKANDTTPSAELLWSINEPGSGNNYQHLGQTWSQPVQGKIRVNGNNKRVLIFAGGYDESQDDSAGTDTIGNAIYIINARTGRKIWWGSSVNSATLRLPEMNYSIPSKVAAYDINGDGYLNRLYVGDMGGQVWRFDITTDSTTKAGLVSGGRIASLSGSGDSEKRRFYYPPDVALIAEPGKSYLGLVMGSGYRAHPLDRTFNDRIYMLKDESPFTAPSSYTTLTEADLYDATDNTIGEGSTTAQSTARTLLNSKKGWRLHMQTGEKALSRPLIVNGVAVLSTFFPEESTEPCKPAGGKGYAYYLNLSDATPTYNLTDQNNVHDDSGLTKEDRQMRLVGGVIPPEPSFLVTEDNGDVNSTLLFGKEIGLDPTSNQQTRAYWFEERGTR